MRGQVGNWIAEGCSTTGIGDLNLTGSNAGFSTFLKGIPSGLVYYSIENGPNREAGIGTFNGVSTITRDMVMATYENSSYDKGDGIASLDPIDLDPDLEGGTVVRCTMNADAFDILAESEDLTAHTDRTDNPHMVTSSQASYIDVPGIGATNAQQALDTIAGMAQNNANDIGTHEADVSDPHDIQADQVDYDNATTGMAATNAQTAIDEVWTKADDGGSGLQSHIDNKNNPHETTALLTTYNNADSNLSAVNVKGALDEVDSKIIATEENLKYLATDITGLYTGGDISQTGPNTISIDAGTGLIVNSYSNPESPTGDSLTWQDIPSYDLLANGGMPVATGRAKTDIGINAANNPVSFPGEASPQQRRDNLILGVVTYADGVIIDVKFSPYVVNQASETSYDLANFLDANLRLKGLTFRPTDVSMNGGLGEFSTWRESGSFFKISINYANSKGNPNVADIATEGSDVSPMLFDPFYMDTVDTSVNLSPTTLVTQQYNDNGTLVAIPNNKFTVHHMLDDIIVGERSLMIGQNTYDSYVEAVAAIISDYITAWKPPSLRGVTLLGHCVMPWAGSSATYFDGILASVVPAGSGSSSGSSGGSAANAIDVAYSDSYGIGSNVQVAIDNVAAVRMTVNQKAGMDAAASPSAINKVVVNTDIDSFQGEISQNAADIITNAGNIAANVTNISTNAGNISTNAGNIATNTGDISTNTGAISTNTGDISTNAGNISTNAGNIGTNTSDIADINSNLINYGGDGNLFVNPDFEISQRGEVTTLSGMGMDRWYQQAVNIAGTINVPIRVLQQLQVARSTSMRCDSVNDDIGNLSICQTFERFKLVQGETYRVRFVVYFYNTTDFGPNAKLAFGTRSDSKNIANAGDLQILVPNINAQTNTWLTLEAEFTASDCIDYLSIGITLYDANITQTNANLFRLVKMQLYAGAIPPSVASNKSVELAKCQEVYQIVQLLDNAGAGVFRLGSSGTVMFGEQRALSVVMRDTPTVVGNALNLNCYGVGGAADKTGLLATLVATKDGYHFQAPANGTNGDMYVGAINSGSNLIFALSAER